MLRLIAQGLRNRGIAKQLVISEKTVGNHISNIFAKLQVNDRSQAIVHTLRSGLVEQEQQHPHEKNGPTYNRSRIGVVLHPLRGRAVRVLKSPNLGYPADRSACLKLHL